MAKRKTGELIWLALRFAISDRIALVDAYSGDLSEPAVLNAKADIKAFEKLLIKLFGTNKSELDSKMSELQPRNIFAVLNNEFDE